MKIGQAIGPDGIPVEVWKGLGEEVPMSLDIRVGRFNPPPGLNPGLTRV